MEGQRVCRGGKGEGCRTGGSEGFCVTMKYLGLDLRRRQQIEMEAGEDGMDSSVESQGKQKHQHQGKQKHQQKQKFTMKETRLDVQSEHVRDDFENSPESLEMTPFRVRRSLWRAIGSVGP